MSKAGADPHGRGAGQCGLGDSFIEETPKKCRVCLAVRGRTAISSAQAFEM